jgi:purine nucleosidase
MTTLLSTDMIGQVARDGDDAAKLLMRMADFYGRSHKTMYPGIQGCGLHDPLAVAVAEDPSLAKTERMLVDVELNGALTRGQTVADRRRTAEHDYNAQVCMWGRPRPLRDRFPVCDQGLTRVR